MATVKQKHAQFVAQMLKIMPRVVSDEDLKDFGQGLDLEDIAKEIVRSGGPYNEHEIRYLVKAVGDMSPAHNFDRDGDYWSDDTVSKYAEHIQNALYKYKPEAVEIDPDIDPEQEHIGPMAQDIEKVNPACVVETKEGVKTVDTGRLALMNAGVIAQLARDFKKLEAKVADNQL
jgi:hypothetical protein